MTAIMRRNAGGDALGCFDRDGEGGAHAFAILARHHVEIKRPAAFARHRQTNQTAAKLGHEIDRFRGGKIRRDDEVAFILAILGVDQDIHLAVAGILDDLVNA